MQIKLLSIDNNQKVNKTTKKTFEKNDNNFQKQDLLLIIQSFLRFETFKENKNNILFLIFVFNFYLFFGFLKNLCEKN
jgi:hypothetical protein